jgi:S1-C subfamily serine protease
MGNPLAGGDAPDGDDLGEDGLHRGWISPDDRLWRHPSEVAALGAPRPGQSAGSSPWWARKRRYGRPVLTGVAAATAAAATIVIVLGLVDAPAGPDAATLPNATDTSMVTGLVESGSAAAASVAPAVPTGQSIMSMATTVSPSLVGLEPDEATKSNAAVITGVVMPGGHLIVSAASALTGVSNVAIFTSDGTRHEGRVIGVDVRAGVAVLKVDGATLTPASFTDEDVEPAELAVTACMCGDSTAIHSTKDAKTASPRLDVAVGMVRGAGLGVDLSDGPDLLDVIEAEMPLGPSAWGGVLLDGDGQVIGVLDGEQTVGADRMGLFVPTHLALGVADELATGSPVVHGWLGLVGTDEPGNGGALVVKVMPNGPAATAGLLAGDVVNAVDSHPVVSLADLQSRLYTEAPGTGVDLSVTMPSGETTMVATLAASPTK